MVQSDFRNALDFMDKIGVFDVVLPFLLIFTIVFAMLEKTRVFGTEEVDGKKYTKKNLNAMASFAIAFFAIASAKVVNALTQISANVVILLFASVFFLMLVGSFHPQAGAEGFALKGWTQGAFIIIMFLGLAGIFLNAIKTSDNKTWLEWIFDWLGQFSTNVSVPTIILMGLVIGVIVFITKGEKPSGAAGGGGAAHP
ncbi:hypothetical protein HYY73_03415 [Candidatus Woesearchaeota archaeon]|nr:hypothetical protein [Candidatus Woesearchaeota archaeon]